MYKFYFLVIAVFSALQPLTLSAQKKLNYEIDLTVDNDVFLGPADKDRYYSSGIFISFRKSIEPTSGLYQWLNKGENVSNLIQGFHINQLVYTSDNITFTDVNLLDRPYAGAHTFAYSLNLFLKNDWIITARQDLGILGPSSQVDDIQTNWHNFFGLPEPRGWIHQINDTPYINLRLEALKAIRLSGGVDVIYESQYEFGTVFNNIRQGITFRLGDLKGLANSGYKNGLIGTELLPERKGKTLEGYFFIGAATEYVIYNSTIQGNFVGESTDFVDEKVDWITHIKFGLNLHWQQFDFGYHVYLNSQENELAGRHAFGRIRLSQRF